MSQVSRITVVSPSRLNAPLIVAGCFEDKGPALEEVSKVLHEAALDAARRPGWRAGMEQVSEVTLKPTRGPVFSLQGLGDSRDFDRRKLGSWLRRVLHAAGVDGATRVAVVLPKAEATKGRAAAERIARELSLVGYRFNRYQNGSSRKAVKSIQLVAPKGQERIYRTGVRTAGAVSSGTALARDLGNAPPNVATPQWVAAEARRVARRHQMKARVLGPKELEKRGMGGLLAVGEGSAHPPRLVRLDWGRSGPTVALVGKGVTFDAGGISLKPPASLDEMKYDKCGACTVLGIAHAVAELKLPLRLRVYLPLVENMPDGAAYRPGDIVSCYNGKTVEITNTDAEGRMILADALSWAVEEHPDWLLELSTLTGSTVIALGQSAAALYTPSDDLAGALLRAADEVGERLWRMPLWPEFVDEMKGNHADLRNMSGRWGGGNTAAAFLSQFVGSLQGWAHLDIAGPAYNSGKGNKGATGYGVALAVRWLQELAPQEG